MKVKKAFFIGLVVLALAAVIGISLYCYVRSSEPDSIGPGDFPEANPNMMVCES